MTTQIKAGVIAANAVNSSELASGALSGQNFTGDVAFDTTTLKIDSSNNRIGIGTSSPAGKVHVQSASSGGSASGNADELILEGSGNTGLTILSGATSLGNLFFADSGDTADGYINYDQNGRSMRFGTATTERMRIDASGNVGIGTSSPAKKLEVAVTGNNQASTVRIQGTDGNGNGHPLDLKMDGASDTFSVLIGQGGGATPNTVLFSGNRNGNVGIGTTSPNHDLHIQSTDPALILAQSGSINNANSGRILFAESPSYTTNNSHFEIKYDGLANHLYFGSPIDGSTDLFVVGRDGNVGIGTDSPDNNKLVITDSSDVGIQITKSGVISTTMKAVSTGLAFGVDASSGNTERMRIDSSGNLLVGHTAQLSASKVLSSFDGATHNGYVARTTYTGTGSNFAVFLNSGNQVAGSINHNGTTSVAYNTSSDARLKDVTGSARGLEVINELNPVSYNWKADGKADEGLIAQEVLDIVPNAVSGSEEEMYQMDYSKLVVHLVKGMKEQQTIIDDLKSRITKLEG